MRVQWSGHEEGVSVSSGMCQQADEVKLDKSSEILLCRVLKAAPGLGGMPLFSVGGLWPISLCSWQELHQFQFGFETLG